MAITKNLIRSDIEDLNLHTFPEMRYEPFPVDDDHATVRWAKTQDGTCVYVQHEAE